jgi:hypothetical protein
VCVAFQTKSDRQNKQKAPGDGGFYFMKLIVQHAKQCEKRKKHYEKLNLNGKLFPFMNLLQ